jgi:enhancing lycopene biosynthesis protein 2
MVDVSSFVADEKNKIITSPCYMMEASIAQVYYGIERAITAFIKWL